MDLVVGKGTFVTRAPGPAPAPAGDKPLASRSPSTALHSPIPSPLDSGLRRNDESKVDCALAHSQAVYPSALTCQCTTLSAGDRVRMDLGGGIAVGVRTRGVGAWIPAPVSGYGACFSTAGVTVEKTPSIQIVNRT